MARVVGKTKREVLRCSGCGRRLYRLLSQMRLFGKGDDKVCPICWFVVKKAEESTECEEAKSTLP